MPKLLISALLLAVLGGCGQKGPLYEEEAPITNQPTPPETTDSKESK